MSADFPSAKPSKGFAIASLILGVVSIPTFGLLVVGAITGIVLGVLALNKIKDHPQAYGGRNLAIAGIATSVVSLVLIAVFGILVAIAVPVFHGSLKEHRQTSAINTLRTIHENQVQFSAVKGRFGTLEELVEAKLVEKEFLSGNGVSGYRYVVSEVSENTYCTHADRVSDSSADRDFVVCEDGVIRFVESKTRDTVSRGEGTPLATEPAPPSATP